MVTRRKGTEPALFGLPIKPTGTVERKAIATIRRWKAAGMDVDPLAERQLRSLASTVDRAEAVGDLGAATRANVALAQIQLMYGFREAPDVDVLAELGKQLREAAGSGAAIRYRNPA